MEKADDGGKGRIVLATVKGDVHDIGKNLVDIIFTNNGYEVHNLGIKVAPRGDARRGRPRWAPTPSACRGLLVKSTLIMRENLLEMNERGLSDIPVILGGAALTRTYVERDLRSGVRGPSVLRQGRLRGPPHHGPAHGAQARAARTTPTSAGPSAAGRRPPRAARARRQRSGRPIPIARPRAPSVATDNPRVRAAVPRVPDRAGHLPRRHRRLPQRDGPVPQPVGLPARQEPARPTPTSRSASGPSCGPSWPRPGPPGSCSPPVAYGYFAVNSDGDDLVVWKDETRTVGVAPLHLPPPADRAVAVHRRLLPLGRRPARPTTPPSTSSPWGPGSRRRPPGSSPRTAIRTTSTCTASASR